MWEYANRVNMFIWNFKKQDLEDGVDVPICNGLSGRGYDPVNISYSSDGETKIEYLKEKNNERDDIRKI